MRNFLGRKTLILGEAGSGKTKLLADFLEFLVEDGHGDDVTVLDMAPPRMQGVGGTLKDQTDLVTKVRYLRPERIWAPRLMGRSMEEVLNYAEDNRRMLDPLIDLVLSSPTKILLVNDLTIYLHRGDVEKVCRLIDASSTFMATGYEGARLEDDKGSGITRRERELLKFLERKVDIVLRV